MSQKPNGDENLDLVTIFELSRETGLSECAIRGRIATGYWIEGKHFYRKGRRIMMDRKACKQYWTESPTWRKK